MTTHQANPHDEWNEQRQLAELDRLVAALQAWIDGRPAWPPFEQAAALWARFAPRLSELQLSLDRLLVVGVVGGSGTGKSTLLNALVGQRVCTASDVQRPTTVRPVVLAAADVPINFLQIEDASPDVHRLASPLLRHMILVDCPDPDTQGDDPAAGNRNRDILRRVLPLCDVMIHTGTAQKYKTEAVAQELLAHAPGRQVIFVQTHAAEDHDIRADWRRHLDAQCFAVPQIFRLDSERALARAEAGQPPDDELHALVRFLHEQLGERARRRIKRTNALDLIDWLLAEMQRTTGAPLAKIDELRTVIDGQSAQLAAKMQAHLAESLQSSAGLWRGRLLDQVMADWGGGPLAMFIRAVGSFGLLTRVFGLARARGMGSLVVGGALAAGKLVGDRWKESAAADAWLQADLGLAPADVAQARSVVEGYALSAELPPPASSAPSLNESLAAAARQMHGQVDSAIDNAIRSRVAKRAGRALHLVLEALFVALPAFLLYRLGANFFYEHHWLGKPLLGLDYWIQSGLWIAIWGLLLRAYLLWRLRSGLTRDLQAVSRDVPITSAIQVIFSDIQQQAEATTRHAQKISELRKQAAALQTELSETESDGLGHLRPS